MNITIEKANLKTIKQAIKLSKKCLIKVKGNNVLKLGISNLVTMDELNYVYVALNEKAKVVGAVEITPFESDDYDWFEISTQKPAMEISHLCVDKKCRGLGVASLMLEFAKQNFKNCVFCADVLYSPIENVSSEKTLLKCGFKPFKTKEWFHKCWNTTFTWNIFKYQNK